MTSFMFGCEACLFRLFRCRALNAVDNVPQTLEHFIERVKTFKFNLSSKRQAKGVVDAKRQSLHFLRDESREAKRPRKQSAHDDKADKVDHFMFAIHFTRLNT